jgi:CRP-like cAMP-binding protein
MSTSQQKPEPVTKEPAGKPTNRLLSALSAADYQRLVPHLELVHLRMKHVAYEPEQPIEYAYFPLTGLASMVTIMQSGKTIEVATIGNEGMIGLPLFLGVDRTAGKAYTQVPGDSLRIKAEVFQKEVSRQGGLARMLQLYTQALMVQISQAMACNSIHPIEQRTARWLLMTHDRVAAARFLMSQEVLSQMLGVRRAGVNEVAKKFRKAGLIRYSRGVVEIVDRAGLEAASCECYGVIQAEFVRLLGAPQKQGPQ